MVTFGEWLRHQRNQLGLTRGQLAERIGCSVALLRKVEDGERRPSAQIAELMSNNLNIPPEQRSTFVKVARGELSVDRLPPMPEPDAATTVPKTNLPVLPTPLIGRQREVEELSQLLRDPQCRLLTLVGPGGIGKTRLAIEAAMHLQDNFANGVYFISFGSVNTTRFILPLIAEATGFAFGNVSHVDPKTQLFSYLKEKQVLLITDNLEHLLSEPGIDLLAELLANVSQVKLLATSREPVGLQGEWVYEVQGLPVPEIQYTEASARNTSVELFVQRARRAHVGFSARPDDYPAIVRICRLVEGMPLGIELAAAWVRTLSCEEIAKEIAGGLDFLSASLRDVPARHHSMRAVFDHSWKLLTEEEQGVLVRLSVFQGGFRRRAAEQVAEARLTVLSTLVTKSLVRRSGEARYDLHELVHQYAIARLSEHSAEQKAIQARHGRFYLTFFAQAEGRLRSSEQREALAELSSEMDNFRAAWDWAINHGEFALIEQTLRSFWPLYDTRGWFLDGLDTLGRAIDALETTRGHSPLNRQTQVALAHLLAVRAWLTYRLGQYDQTKTMLEHSLGILRPLNEPRVLVVSIHFLGQVMEVTGDYARALELYLEGLEMAEAINDRWYIAVFHTHLHGLIANTDVIIKPENTHEQLQAAVAEWRLIGDHRMTAFGLRILSQSAFISGRYEESRLALQESAELNNSVGDRWGLGSAYRGLGLIAQVQGNHQQAITMFRKSLDTFTELGGIWWVARVLSEMTQSVFAQGNEAEADHIGREALRLATGIQAIPVMLEALAGIADLQVKRDDLAYALELLLIVLTHPSSFQETRNRAAHQRAELEAQLTGQQVEAALARAQAKTLETAVDEVLKRA